MKLSIIETVGAIKREFSCFDENSESAINGMIDIYSRINEADKVVKRDTAETNEPGVFGWVDSQGATHFYVEPGLRNKAYHLSFDENGFSHLECEK